MLSYEPLWNTLLKKKLKKYDLVVNKVISSATLAKLGKDEHVHSSVYDRLCKFLNCELSDVVEYVDNNN